MRWSAQAHADQGDRRAKKKSKRKLVVKVSAAYTPKKGSTVAGEAVKASKASKKATFKK